MNHVLDSAVVEYAWLMGVTTVLFMVCFVGWTWWAYSKPNRERMNEAALLPLLEDDE